MPRWIQELQLHVWWMLQSMKISNGLLFLPCYQIQFTSLSLCNLNEIGSKKCNFGPILGTHIAVQYRSRREGNMPLIVQSSLVPQRPILLHTAKRGSYDPNARFPFVVKSYWQASFEIEFQFRRNNTQDCFRYSYR